MNKRLTKLAIVAALLAATGCEGVKQELGIGAKRPPDEFAVYSRAPLAMPPDFALRPPASGAAVESQVARQSAKDVLLGGSAVGAAGRPPAPPSTDLAAMSPALQELMRRTGGATTTTDIRDQVNRENTVLAEADQPFIEKLMFWRKPEDYGTVVDAPQEARRIRETQALGQPIVTGQTPTIAKPQKGPLEGIF